MGAVRRRILVVEDDPTLRSLFRRRAARAGFLVLEADTIAQGVALAASERPDLILLDLHLSDGNGSQMMEQLRVDSRTASIPIVPWSGSAPEQSETEMMRMGVAAYFQKSDLRALASRIVELLHQADE